MYQFFRTRFTFQDSNDQLQLKIRTYKQQVEDAEEIATSYLAKYRKSRKEVEEAEKRINVAEQALSNFKSKSLVSGNLSALSF